MNIRIDSQRLKSSMAKRNQTTLSLAKKTGISQSAISSYINAKSFPNEERLKKIANELNVNYEWLTGNSNNEEILEDLTIIQRITKNLEFINEKELKAIEKLVEELSGY